MKIITNLLKDAADEKIVLMTSYINSVNPMVDRIMEDDSVEGVVMTNELGAPILTNMNNTVACTGGMKLTALGAMAFRIIKEMDPFDEILALRLQTKRVEILVAPHLQFNVIVFQHSRTKTKMHNPPPDTPKSKK